jgi:hypothetical protein
MPKQSQDEKAQIERFIETSRALGCDQDKEKFEASLSAIAHFKPPPKTPKNPRNKKSKPAQ